MENIINKIKEFVPIILGYSIFYILFTVLDDTSFIFNSFNYLFSLSILTLLYIIYYGKIFWKRKIKNFSVFALLISYILILFISFLVIFIIGNIDDPFLPVYNIVFLLIFEILFLIFYTALIFKNYLEEIIESRKKINSLTKKKK